MCTGMYMYVKMFCYPQRCAFASKNTYFEYTKSKIDISLLHANRKNIPFDQVHGYVMNHTKNQNILNLYKAKTTSIL